MEPPGGMRMRPLLVAVVAAALLSVVVTVPVMAGGAPAIEWETLLGGNGDDEGVSVQQTTDGGYILLGSSQSSASGDVTGTNHGPLYPDGTGTDDVWLVKLGPAGAVEWQRLLGGEGYDHGSSVQQTADGGYILLGASTSSQSGDVDGTNHRAAWWDVWVVRLDASGAIVWQRLLGGTEDEGAGAIRPTADGGSIFVGSSDSSANGDVAGTNHGDGDSGDLWVVRLDAAGGIVWQRLLGGPDHEFGSDVRPTADGGYVVLGYSDSVWTGEVGDEAGRTHGYVDFWVVKLDGSGAVQWQRQLGGGQSEWGSSVQQTADGGYILLGSSYSSASGDVNGTGHGYSDCWVVKLTGAGGTEWERLLGGNGVESGRSVVEARGGGYLLLGMSTSSANGDVSDTNHGEGWYDCWAVRLDPHGTILWDRLLGGDDIEEGYCARQTADGGFVLAGKSWSSASGDVGGTLHGGFADVDVWVVKLGADGPAAVALPGGGVPGDTDRDGTAEDVNGNGRPDFADVVLYFNNMGWIAANEPVALFDYNANGRVDFADVVWLFNHI